MKKLAALVLLVGGVAMAKGPQPEDLLKGRIIISDKRLPTSWNSPSSYVAQLKGLNKGTLWYDKKSGKLTVQYAAFFARPVNDVQVMLTLTDITNGGHQQKATTEQFLARGDRVIFNAVEFDKEDIEGNKKYLMTIATRGQVIATGTFILREEGPHYSGKVTFTDDDTKSGSEAH
jgi:hypothetical protein